MEEREVDLTVNIDSFMDKDRGYRQALSSRLVSDQVVANHALCFLSDLLWRVEHMDTTLHAAGKMAFASSTSLDLSFDDEALGVVKAASNSESLLSRTR